MKRVVRLCVCAAVPLLSGCATRSDVLRVERQVLAQVAAGRQGDSIIAANVATLARLLQAVSDSVRAQQTMLTSLRGDTRTQLYNIQQQLIAIQELTGQSQQRLSEMRAQMELRANRVDPPVAVPAPGTTAATPASPSGAEPGAEELMDLSIQQLRRGSPGTARTGFTEFLRRFATHARAVDAVFFTGEAWAAEQRADSAATAYRLVVQRYPQSPRAPSALYRLGLQALAAGRTAEARDAFNRVVGTYAASEEATLARERLRSLPQR